MSLYRNLITMLSASVLRSKPFDDVSDKNVQGSLESLNLKINTVAAQNVRLTTLGLPAASGSVLGDFIRLKDTAGVRSLDRGVSSTGAWIQSRSSSDYTVNYTLLLNPNGGTVATGGPVTVTGASASVSVGTNPSQSGAFRLANTQTIRWRNAANSADGFYITQSAANALVIYDPSNNPLFTINAAGLTLPGPLTVGGFEVGTKILPQSIKSVDYTLVLTDSGTHILHPTADTSTRTFTIPSNASVAFPAGTTVTFINQISAGNVYVDIVTDTMVLAGVGQTSSVLLAPNSIATAFKVTTTQWLITLIDSQSLTLAQQQDLSANLAVVQDLSAVTSASLHRSPSAITGVFVYDTSKDSDGGAWVEKVGHTSWMNEPLNGSWLTGGFATELAARGDNLLVAAEQFDTTSWGKQGTGGIIVTADSATAPDGTHTADKLIASTAAGTHYLQRDITFAALTPYAYTVHVKAGEVSKLRLFLYSTTYGTTFNAATGSFEGTAAGLTVSAKAVGAGWWQVVLSATSTASPVNRLEIYTADNSAGNGTDGIYIWGAKLNKVGEFPSTYSASPELVSNGRFDSGTVGWTSNTGATSTAAVVAGELQVTATAGYGTQYQVFNTVIGKTYSVSCSMRRVSGIGIIYAALSNNTTSASDLQTIGTTTLATATVKTGVFTATTNQVNISLRTSVIGDVGGFDDISVKEVTTLATPYVPYSTQTGSYYQSSADGKFYKLGAGYGELTEVFRGNKAKFPRLAAIVAEGSAVTIYDLTEPGRPMWMRFANPTEGTFAIPALGGQIGTAGPVAALNGTIVVCGTGGYSSQGLVRWDFIGDRFGNHASFTWSGWTTGNLVERNTVKAINTSTLSALVNATVNAVAMTVLPDAPTDVSTGLQVPTIAVATAGGVSVIKHDGTVVNPSATTGGNVSFDTRGNTVNIGENNRNYRKALAPNYTTNLTYIGGPLSLNGATNVVSGSPISKVGKGVSALLRYTNIGVGFLKENDQSSGKVMYAEVAATYGTGYQLGDIRRAYLCSTEVESVTAPELVVNGGFDTDAAGWIGLYATPSVTAGVVRVTCDGSSGSPGRIYRAFGTVSGKIYRLTATVTGGNTTASVGVNFTGSPSIDVVAGAAAAGVTQSLNKLFTATSATVAVILYTGSAVGHFGDFDNISCKEVVPDRSYKASGANIFGTLTKSAVATGAQLVAYSGFSAVNYIQETYSADLDFGTSEWRAGGPVTIPAVLPVSSFPVIGATTVVNGDFAAGSANWTTQNGASPITVVSGAANLSSAGTQYAQQLGMTLEANKTYRIRITFAVGSSSPAVKVSLVTGNYLAGEQIVTGIQNVSGPTAYDVIVKTNGAKNGLIIKEQNANGSVLVVDDVSIMEVGPSIFVDRSAATGPKWSLGLDGAGMLVGTAFDGTTTRTVTTTTAYNSGTVIKPVLQYTTDGRLAIEVNGKEVAAATGTPLLTMNNAAAVLTIGNTRTLDAPFPGTISNQHIGATAATVEQATWMYGQEKHMFRDNAQITLPAATSVLDLSYDESRDRWTALQAGHESTFKGLIRTSVSTPSAGSFAKVRTHGGVKLISRTTSSPGVDITIPAISLRNEVLKIGNKTDQKLPLKPFEYDAVASQVDFPIPAGFVPIRVAVAGVIKREGSTKDYTLLHDGFIWTVRFAVAPGAAAWVQITPVLE